MKHFTTILLLFLTGFVLAQNELSLSGGTTVNTISTCQENVFELNLEKTGGFVAGDVTVLSFNLMPGIELTGSTNNPSEVQQTDPATLTVTGITGPSYTVSYTLRPGCGYFQANTVSGITHQITAELNNTEIIQTDNHSETYSINAPVLVFRSDLSEKLNYTLAEYAGTYTRKYVWENTGLIPFTGFLHFTNNLEVLPPDASVEITQIRVYGASYELLSTFNASGSELQFEVLDLPVNETFYIEEDILVIGCSKEASEAHFQLDYGCLNSVSCETVEENPTTWAELDQSVKPELMKSNPNVSGYNEMLGGYEACLTDPQDRMIEIINIGNGTATNMKFTVFGTDYADGIWRNYSKIDPASVILTHLVDDGVGGLVEVPMTFYAVGPVNTARAYTGRNPYQQYFQEFETDETIEPGEVIYLRYQEQIKCFDQADIDYLTNKNYRISNTYIGVQLVHPCLSTNEYYSDPLLHGSPGTRQHHYSFTQRFDNLEHPSVVNQEDAWFEVDEGSPFRLGTDNENGVGFDLGQSELQVRIDVEPGFEFLPNSIYMVSNQGGTPVDWLPVSIDYFGDVTGGDAQGGYAIAHFEFPANFYTVQPSVVDGQGRTRYPVFGNVSKFTSDYNLFFNDFKVRFQLRAHCTQVVDSKARITQRLSFVPFKNCSPQCVMPLSAVGDMIRFLCPGCVLPGFNVSQFDVKRTNIGFADANNNHLPDDADYLNSTADPTLIEDRHVMIGDEIQIDLAAITSTGPEWDFSNLGFPLDEGQVFIQGPFLKNLEFLGATGTFNGIPITIPPAAGVLSDETFVGPDPQASIDLFSINIGQAAMQSYGLSAFTSFQYNDELVIHPQFRVKENLVNGSGSNPRFSVEELVSFVYMSGEPFTGYRQRADANELYKLDPDDYSPRPLEERQAMDYWCTGAFARLLGVGIDFKPTTAGNHTEINDNYWGYGGPDLADNYPRANPCFKTMMQLNYVGIGEQAGSYYYTNQTPAIQDAFPFELRNLWKKTRVEIEFPSQYYEPERVVIDMGQYIYRSDLNAHKYHRYSVTIPVAGNPNITVSGSTMTVNLLPYYGFATDNTGMSTGFVQINDELLNFDEGFINDVYAAFKMKECDVPEQVDVEGLEMRHYFEQFPFNQWQPQVVTTSYGANSYFDKPSAQLEFDPVDQVSYDGNWEAVLSTVVPFTGSYDDYVNNSAQNTFIYFESPNNNILVDGVQNNGVQLPVVGTINGQPVYGLGTIGANRPTSKEIIANLDIQATLDCSGGGTHEPLIVHFGWNCYDYPASLEEACYTNQTVLYYDVRETGLQSGLTGASQLAPCSEGSYEILLHPTGSGNVENVDIVVDLPTGMSYVSGSGLVLFGSNESVEPVVSGQQLHWDLSGLNLIDNLNSTTEDAFLQFKVSNNCDLMSQAITATVNSTNFCGNALPQIPLSLPIGSNPALGAQVLSVDHSGLCNGSNTLILQINNGQQTAIDFTVYDANDQPIGSFSQSDIALNTTGSYTLTLTTASTEFYILWNSCSCNERFDYSYSCGEPCDPNAAFTVENICKGLNVSPIPASTEGIHSWTFSYLNQTSSQVSPVFPATQAGIYTITHTVTLPCGETVTETQQVEVFQPEYTSIILTGNSPLCEGETATLTVANADHFTEFEWSTGETTPEITVNSGGYYHVDVTDANGCVSHCSSITITEMDRPDDQTETIYICSETDQVTLDAGDGYESYHWLFNGATTQAVTVTGPGIYVAEICNSANGTCCGTYTFNVELERVAIPVLPDLVLCPGVSQTVTSPVVADGYSYSWTYNGNVISTTDQAVVSDPGMYELTITTDIGCPHTVQFNVTNFPPAVSTFTLPEEMCLEAGTLCVSPEVNDAGYFHRWIFTQNGNTLLDTDLPEPCVILTTAGILEIEHIVNNECGVSSTTHSIMIQDVVTDEQRTVYICSETDQVTLDAGDGYGSYFWNVDNAATQVIAVTGPGTYVATVCNGNTTCCGTITFQVELESLTFDVPDVALCPGTAVTITSPVQAETYSWTHNDIELSSTDQVQVSEAGSYELEITSVNGCTYSDPFEVTLLPEPVSSFSASDIICTTSDATCFSPETDDPGFSHHWIFTQNGSSMHFYETAPCVDFSSPGEVTVEHIVTNSCGTSTSSATIQVVEAVEGGCIEIIGQNPMCPGSTVTLTTSGDYVSVEWHDGNGNLIGTGSSITVSTAGVYSATATDANGCVSTCICTTLSEAHVDYQRLDDLVLCPGETGHQYIKGNGAWSTGTYGDTEHFTEAGNYYVDIVSPEGCSYREEFSVTYASMSATIVIEDAKSPMNGPCNYSFTASGVSSGAVSFDWYVNNSYVGSGQQFTYSHSGLALIGATIKLVIRDQYGCTYEFTATKNFKACMGGLSAGGHGPQMIVAPNPFERELTVSYVLENGARGELRLIDMRNKEVFRTGLPTLTDQVQLNLENLSSGTYMLQLYGDGVLIESQRVIKLK